MLNLSLATPQDPRLLDAVQFAVDHETTWSRDTENQAWGVHQQDPPPWNRLLGPVHGRGPVSGVIVQNGQLSAHWGEPERADLTFSIAKTYLALLAGVAQDRGLLTDLNEPVHKRVPGIGFEGEHNAQVTWLQLLQQTSEWEGSCFDVPDQVDRYRSVKFQAKEVTGTKGDARPLQVPGSYWEYNDVRINQLSLALLHLFGRALPEVFDEAIMRPIGASSDWRWVGYDNAWVELANGKRVQSVPGGSHWGGGMSISSVDQARIGQLLLDQGRANGRQVIPAAWVERMRTPCAIAPFYGCLVFLNPGHSVFPSLPEDSYFAVGAGSSLTWVAPAQRLVAVVRWINADHADGFFGRVLRALA